MLRIFKWIGIALASLIGLVVIVAVVLNVIGRRKANSPPDVATTPVTIAASDTSLLARGRHLADFMGCEGCHGPGLSGKTFPTPAFLVAMAAPNLTRGEGGVGAAYTPEEWERAIRHGVARDGRRLIIMPSEAYTHLNDTDAAALIAYLQTLQPIQQSFPARKIGVLGGALLGAGLFPTIPDMIAHDSVGKRLAVAPAVSADYGRYLGSVTGCNICHGPDLRGGKEGGNGPPPGPSLVAFVANNSSEAFRNTIRTGTTPAGRALNPEFMPWKSFAKMTDDELEAIRLYIQSTYARTTGP
jgi:mono/diheme cytochrome c family protein